MTDVLPDSVHPDVAADRTRIEEAVAEGRTLIDALADTVDARTATSRRTPTGTGRRRARPGAR